MLVRGGPLALLLLIGRPAWRRDRTPEWDVKAASTVADASQCGVVQVLHPWLASRHD